MAVDKRDDDTSLLSFRLEGDGLGGGAGSSGRSLKERDRTHRVVGAPHLPQMITHRVVGAPHPPR